MKSGKKIAIFILGMDRTGTSALTGVLNTLGVYLGNNPITITPDNPKGFFEEADTLEINKNILREIGGSDTWWYETFPEINLTSTNATFHVATIKKHLRKKFAQSHLFAIKDPRISFIFPLYAEACRQLDIEIRIIVTLRPYREIQESIKKRNDISFESTYKSTVEHYKKILASTDKYPRITVHYHDLISLPRNTVNSLLRFIPELTPTPSQVSQACSPVTPELRHRVDPGTDLLTFVGIGAQKSGTTTLWKILSQHPQVTVPDQKEVHYFDYPEHYILGEEWYKSQFPTENNSTICGEITPYYLFHPGVPRKLSRITKHPKIIVVLRNPVDRAWSHYHHSKKLSLESLPFVEALLVESKRISDAHNRLRSDDLYYSSDHQHASYLKRGLYYEQLLNWYSYFDVSNFLIISFDELTLQQQEATIRIARFLNIEPVHLAAFHENEGCTPPIPNWYRWILEAYYLPENEKLSKIVPVTWKASFPAQLIYFFCTVTAISPLSLLNLFFYVNLLLLWFLMSYFAWKIIRSSPARSSSTSPVTVACAP